MDFELSYLPLRAGVCGWLRWLDLDSASPDLLVYFSAVESAGLSVQIFYELLSLNYFF